MTRKYHASSSLMTIDNPNVRKSETCPLCIGPKDRGLVACWPCYRLHNMRNGNPNAESIIASVELTLVCCGGRS